MKIVVGVFGLLIVATKAFAPESNKLSSLSGASAREWSLSSCRKVDDAQINRRTAVNGIASTASLLVGLKPNKASAATNEKPKEFIDVGPQAPAPEGEREFVELANGVKVKEFRSGSEDAVVQADSQQVMIQVSGRLLNLNGVVFYNTKNNNPDGFGAVPLTINLGKGEALPGLESGIVGMKKGGIRRIIVPADLAYSKFPDLEPKPTSTNDQRALDSVVKNPRRDATILFDVSVERFK